MDCQKCNDLIINSENPKKTIFHCGINKKQILNPANYQRWCPKRRNRKGELVKEDRQDKTIQTTHMEMQLLQQWFADNKLKTLKGYLKGIACRDKATCPFSVEQVSVFAKSKIKELENRDGAAAS